MPKTTIYPDVHASPSLFYDWAEAVRFSYCSKFANDEEANFFGKIDRLKFAISVVDVLLLRTAIHECQTFITGPNPILNALSFLHLASKGESVVLSCDGNDPFWNYQWVNLPAFRHAINEVFGLKIPVYLSFDGWRSSFFSAVAHRIVQANNPRALVLNRQQSTCLRNDLTKDGDLLFAVTNRVPQKQSMADMRILATSLTMMMLEMPALKFTRGRTSGQLIVQRCLITGFSSGLCRPPRADAAPNAPVDWVHPDRFVLLGAARGRPLNEKDSLKSAMEDICLIKGV